jgi:hypothetical protein
MERTVSLPLLIAIGLAFAGSDAFGAFQVTGASLSAAPTAYEGCCPTTIKFSGKITVNGRGTVQYTFTRSDGATGPTHSLTFDAAGTKDVSTSWTLGGASLPTYSGWQAIKIVSPNPMESSRAAFRLACLFQDPSAVKVGFQVLSKDRTWPTRGRIRITGEVKNVGSTPFQSDPRQAIAYLNEASPGARPVTRAQQDIGSLAAGASIMLNYERDWDTATEFPPTYTLQITYDPDIYLDANKKNDDCNQKNNKAELTGTAINAAWPR